MKVAGLGWLPDFPDFRDYTVDKKEAPGRAKAAGQGDPVNAMLMKAGVAKARKTKLAQKTDLQWCSDVEDQDDPGSCTANTAAGIREYFERRAFDRHIDASRLFVYKVTRNLMNVNGDTESFYPDHDGVPWFSLAFHRKSIGRTELRSLTESQQASYAFCPEFPAVNYYRYDPPGTSTEELQSRIKMNLAAGLPAMFGFTVYRSIYDVEDTGRIPFPSSSEENVGGHAVVAVGYDDKLRIRNVNPGGKETIGAFLIRNSWGPHWGEDGYGWLPYEYVKRGLADDWWSLLKNEWIDTGQFEIT